MKPQPTTRHRVALLVCSLAAAVFGIGPLYVGGAAASPGGHTTHRTPGFVLTDHGLIAPLGKYQSVTGDVAVDRNGGEHVVAALRMAGHKYSEIRYYSRNPGQKRFSEDPMAYRIARAHPVHTLISADGKRVITVLSNSQGAWTAETPIKSHQMPVPKVAAHCTPDECADEVPFGLVGAVALPHHRLALLAEINGGPVRLFVGTPGHRFRVSPQSAELSGTMFVSSFVRDPVTGEEVIVNTKVSPPPSQAMVRTRMPGGQWSAPRAVADLPFGVGAESFRIADAAASNGHIVIALAQNDRPANAAQPPIELVERTAAGEWLAPTRPAHLTVRDLEPQVALSPGGGRLVLAFERRNTDDPRARGTVRSEYRNSSGWSTLRTLTSHASYQDISTLALGRHNKPIVAFVRYKSADYL